MAKPTMTMQLTTGAGAVGYVSLVASDDATAAAIAFATATGDAVTGTMSCPAGRARTATCTTVNASTALTSTTARFSQRDVGKPIVGTGIADDTVIVSVESTTTATLSASATADGTVTLTIDVDGLLTFPALNPNQAEDGFSPSDDVIDDPTGTVWQLIVIAPNTPTPDPIYFRAPDREGVYQIAGSLLTSRPGALLPPGVTAALEPLVEAAVGDQIEVDDLPIGLTALTAGDYLLARQDGGLVVRDVDDVLDRDNHTGTLPYAAVPAAALDRTNHTGTLPYAAVPSQALDRANHTGIMPYTALEGAPRLQWRASVNQGIPNNVWTAIGFSTLDANVGGIGAHISASTTVAAGSNGQTLPTGTINVASTTGFPSSGSLLINGPSAASTTMLVAYTGVTATSFTGCTLGAGTLATNQVVTPANNVVTLSTLGIYSLSATVSFAANGTGRRGLRFILSSVLPVGQVDQANIGAFAHSITSTITFPVTTTSTIQVHAFQISTATLNSVSDNVNAPRLNIEWLRPLGS